MEKFIHRNITRIVVKIPEVFAKFSQTSTNCPKVLFQMVVSVKPKTPLQKYNALNDMVIKIIKSLIEALVQCLYICNCFLLILQNFFFQVVRYGFKNWVSSYWNIWDAAVIILFLLGFSLRICGLLIDGRIVYAIDLMLFIVRILEMFYVDKTLGPYVVMSGRMVSYAARPMYLQKEYLL